MAGFDKNIKILFFLYFILFLTKDSDADQRICFKEKQNIKSPGSLFVFASKDNPI